MKQLKELFLNLWWSIKYFKTDTTKEIRNGIILTAKGSSIKARGKR